MKNWKKDGQSRWAATTPGTGWIDSTTDALLVEREVEQKYKREKDGKDLLIQWTAELNVDRRKNSIDSDLFNQDVEEILAGVKNYVNTGDLLSAYNYLNRIVIDGGNTTLTEAMLTDYRTRISTYLTTSGNYDEFTGDSIDGSGNLI